MDEPITKSRIQWQCRRGMLELDFIFERFVNQQFDNLTEQDKKLLLELLSLDDPMLWDWLVEDIPVSDLRFAILTNKIKQSR